MSEKQAIALMIVIAIIMTAALIFTGFAVAHCGWSSLFWGKNVFWAWVFGYCN